MSFLDPVELPKPKVGPELMVGAASPLWGYFGAAAMGGVAYWWMTQWTRPMNLEALFGLATATLPKAEEVAPAAEAVAEAMTAPVLAASETAVSELPPIGGEAAPISPVAAVETPIEPTSDIAQATAPAVEDALDTLSDSVAKTTEAAVQPLAEAASFASNGADPDGTGLEAGEDPTPVSPAKGRKSAARDA
jgi:hypothetical protein